MESKVNGINISNPNRVIYKEENITKLDVAKYYKDISCKIMKFLENRPISVIRCHNSIYEECFFKKHPMPNENVEKIKIGSSNPYFYLNNTKQLISQIQMGTIEFHTWASKVDKINSPDIMVFDLDPDEHISFTKLKQGVLLLKNLLDELNLRSFLKTSGGKGYHILIPFKNIKNYNKFNKFAENIAKILEKKFDLFTTNIRKENRKNKIFIDFLRNKKGSTCVCPYSLRVRKKAPISMPIAWEDLDKIKPNQINLKNYKKYLNNSWKNFFNINQTLE